MTATSRPYGGRSAVQRRTERRALLLEAALDIWGEHGWAAVTMRGVCAKAGLSDRYFYESFTDRDALLVTVWDQAQEELIAIVLQAVADAPPQPPAQLRAAIAAFVHSVADDPRRGRIGFGEHAGSPVLEQRRRDGFRTFADLVVQQAHQHLGEPDLDEVALQVGALMVVGGLGELITNWLGGSLPLNAEQLIDHAATAALAMAAPLLP